jgi:hypothetical protein
MASSWPHLFILCHHGMRVRIKSKNDRAVRNKAGRQRAKVHPAELTALCGEPQSWRMMRGSYARGWEALVTARRFPPPWQVEQIDGGFKVLDASGQALVYVYSNVIRTWLAFHSNSLGSYFTVDRSGARQHPPNSSPGFLILSSE